MGKLVGTIPLMAVLLVGCASTGERHPQSGAAATQGLSGQYSDAKLVAAHPQLLDRRAGVLKVRGQTFTDEGRCELGDCTRYRADGVWKGEHVGIEVAYYEEGDYLLVDRNDQIPLGSRPISSPSGTRFFTGHHNDSRWSPYQGASVWEWEPHPRRLRIVDTDLVVFHSFVGWRGDSCVEFTGARGFNVKAQPTRTFWLAEQQGDWQLLEQRPSVCAQALP